jgi:hypothetical protein
MRNEPSLIIHNFLYFRSVEGSSTRKLHRKENGIDADSQRRKNMAGDTDVNPEIQELGAVEMRN